MTFYIGDSVKEVNVKEKYVVFSDDLLDYIYRVNRHTSVDMSELFAIDPYAHVEISIEDLPRIIEICSYMIDASLLENYIEREEGIESIHSLMEMAEQAIERGKGLVSIGD